MSDDPVRTWVRSPAGWCSFQEFMIREHAQGIVEGLEFRGAEQAAPSEQALAAIAGARAIVIGPSNPLASIAPILAVPGMREALSGAAAPVVAVSPVVGGKIL
ncbi:MAG TPA: 2-phospho-L-lactate transferase CofD family protein, partial [Solirubrobacteraceae bacterium]|nr:2-phospho-L-lactate transferase CofD family protein [Solirubrobacteraceae bacterium]